MCIRDSIGAVNAYMFRQVSGNHTLEVTFVKETQNPQTGDFSNPMLWVGLLLVSAFAFTGTVLYRRRKA